MSAAHPLPTNSSRRAGKRRRELTETPRGNAKVSTGVAVARAESVRLAIKMLDFTWVYPEYRSTKNTARLRDAQTGPYGTGARPPLVVAVLELSRQLIAEM